MAGLTAWSGYQCLDLEVDESNRSMRSDDPAQDEIEERFRELFGDEEILFVAISMPELTSPEGRRRIFELDADFESVEGVRRAVSLADHDFEPPDAAAEIFLSADRETSGIQLLLDSGATEEEMLRRLVEDIEGVVLRHETEDIRIAVSGLALQKYNAGVLVRKDQKLFAPLSLLVLGLVLLWITRRVSGMLFPLLVSALTICWTLGLYARSGLELNMITSLLPPVIMTLSVACTMHVYLRWLHSEESDRVRRIADAVAALYRPCLFATMTTAIGFLSLTISPTPAIRHFGLYAALGVGLAYVLGVFGLAVGLSFLSPPARHRRDLADSPVLVRLLDATARLSLAHPRKIVLGAMIVTLVGVFGIRKVESDTNILHFLGEDSRLYRDTVFIEENLVGTSQLELILERSEPGEPIDFEDLDRIEDFQERVNGLGPIRHSTSVVDLLAEAPAPPESLGIPLADLLGRPEFENYVGPDREHFRISVLLDSIGTADGEGILGRVRGLAEEVFGKDFRLRVTGEFYRVVEGSNTLVEIQAKSFFIAIAVILLAIGVVFRSPVLALLSVVPNVVPLLLTGAIMGYSGIALSTGTMMIASVAIGIAVDDTIHYLSGYRRAGRPSRPISGAASRIRRTTRSTGLALFATTTALSAGFWVAMFGSFLPTVYFALLSGLTMWFALVCDLLVLPALIVLLSRRRNLFLKNGKPSPTS